MDIHFDNQAVIVTGAARGIGGGIVEGFVDPLVAEVPIPGLREELRREIQRRVTSAQTSLSE